MSEMTGGKAHADAPANGRVPDATTIEARLDELRAELEAGTRRLAELDAERARVRDTMLRIEGAIMALSELDDAPADPT